MRQTRNSHWSRFIFIFAFSFFCRRSNERKNKNDFIVAISSGTKTRTIFAFAWFRFNFVFQFYRDLIRCVQMTCNKSKIIPITENAFFGICANENKSTQNKSKKKKAKNILPPKSRIKMSPFFFQFVSIQFQFFILFVFFFLQWPVSMVRSWQFHALIDWIWAPIYALHQMEFRRLSASVLCSSFIVSNSKQKKKNKMLSNLYIRRLCWMIKYPDK